LYKKFLEKKLDVCFEEKKEIDFSRPGLKDEFISKRYKIVKNYQQAALYSILNSNDYHMFFKEKPDEKYSWDIGVIDEIKDGKFIFVHQTIAEFLVADYFLDFLSEKKVQYYLLFHVLIRPEYCMIRSFLNGHLKKREIIIIKQDIFFGVLFKILLLMIEENNFELVRLFLNQLPDDQKLYALNLGGYRDGLEFIHPLFEFFENFKSFPHETLLHKATSRGHTDIVKLLINEGAFVDCKNDEYCTPLHLAASSGHKDIVELFINQGAFTDYENFNDSIPLYFAFPYKFRDLAEFLIYNSEALDSENINS
jgi:hypothetical protein